MNAALQGVFCDIGRGFLRVFGKVKAQVLLAFSVAAFNPDRVRAYLAKQHREMGTIVRPKRRRGTWAELVEPSTIVSGTAASVGEPRGTTCTVTQRSEPSG